ncbi:hypothetical protein OsJ_03130 [Oryza sativa Japonica Group]|uniref:Uncharacterized protein n=1 Tax=Oryza sativa subsp. japonica TaxID=39947 RepID=A2ZWW3_ORYSJ|nr:hypothetical protein OsJ_03130 [Oryza sativa Japonica Group]
MAENPLLDEVVAMYFHLVDNPDDARALLDDAHFNAAENDHEIAMVGIQLRHIQHQTNELMTQPMTDAEREAQRVQLEEDYRGIKVDADFLLENRRQLRPSRQDARLHLDLRHHQARLAALPPRRGPHVRGRNRRLGRLRRVEARRHGARVRGPREDLHLADVLLPLGLSGSPLIDRATCHSCCLRAFHW